MKKLYWGLLISSLITTVLIFLLAVLDVGILVNILTLLLILEAVAVTIIYFGFVKFRCPKCKTVFKGKYWQIFIDPHTITKRMMQCPFCRDWLWCEDVFESKKDK